MLGIFLVGKKSPSPTLAAHARLQDARTHARTGPGTSEWANLFERRVQGGLELSKRRQVEDKMCASDASSAFGARRQREPKAFTPENGAEPHRRVSNSLILALLLKADLF